MVVNTRSKHQCHEHQHEHEDEELLSIKKNTEDIRVHIKGGCIGGVAGTKIRHVTILTPSLIDASAKTYKVYSPVIKQPTSPQDVTTNKTKKKQKKNKSHKIMLQEAAEVVDAADALVSLLQYEDTDTNTQHDQEIEDTVSQTPPSPPSSTTAVHERSIHTCMNPMQPVSQFIYRIGVYNINQTQHYKSAYVLYDQKSRMFHVYTIISNKLPSSDEEDSHASADTTTVMPTAFTLPIPQNTIQTKYTSYISDIISNYISTMIIPSNDFDYYIQDDIIGIVVPNDEFREKAFDEESSYYDIEDLMYDNTSTQTTNGYKAFMLIPSRNFWYSPLGGYYAITDANTIAYSDRRYTPDILTSVMMILSQST